jgi:murein DD-endopeptidase MepM/ murein hydrolase activator NlpD
LVLRPGQPLQLVYPLPERAAEVDPYGWRWSPSRQAWRMHAGQDLITAAGTPVLAMLPGRVVLVDDIDGYGLTVLLDHGRGWQTLYAHLLEAAVLPGAQLAAGERLGRVGQSGRASTAHLHVELRRRTPGGMVALDPTPLLADAVAALPPPQALQAQGLRPASP